MAVAQQSAEFALLSRDNMNSIDAVLSRIAVNTDNIPFWRAVLTVKGEQKTILWHQTSISSGVSPKTPQQVSTPHFGSREKTGVGDPTG